MGQTPGDEKQVGKVTASPLRELYPIADIVSLETVVNLLIRKGVLTPEELYEEEQNLRRDLEKIKQTRPVEIDRNGVPNTKKGNWLKRKMSKRLWTRRLGTSLFDWKWKKIKNNHDPKLIQNRAE